MTFEEATKSCYDWWENGINSRFHEAAVINFLYYGKNFWKISCKSCSRNNDCYYRSHLNAHGEEVEFCGFYKDNKNDFHESIEEFHRKEEERQKNMTDEERAKAYIHVIEMLDKISSDYKDQKKHDI